MKLLEKLKILNKYVGFNLLGLNGIVFFVILLKTIYNGYYIDCIINHNLSGQGILAWTVIIIILYAGSIASFLVGVCLYETTTQYRIKNKLLTQNPVIILFKYIGILFSIFYILLAIIIPLLLFFG
jgi:hypothetical protein